MLLIFSFFLGCRHDAGSLFMPAFAVSAVTRILQTGSFGIQTAEKKIRVKCYKSATIVAMKEARYNKKLKNKTESCL
jgi:PP-loop superfamily ATP-utilizing enzyme